MILTQSEFARELEVTRARITQFIQRGMPIRPDRRIDLLKPSGGSATTLIPATLVRRSAMRASGCISFNDAQAAADRAPSA